MHAHISPGLAWCYSSPQSHRASCPEGVLMSHPLRVLNYEWSGNGIAVFFRVLVRLISSGPSVPECGLCQEREFLRKTSILLPARETLSTATNTHLPLKHRKPREGTTAAESLLEIGRQPRLGTHRMWTKEGGVEAQKVETHSGVWG